LRCVREYVAYIKGFSHNAKLYLWSSLLGSIASGLTYVVFNLYLLRIGHAESFLGQLVFYSAIAGTLFALPAGRASDRFGRRRSLLVSEAVAISAVLAQVVKPVPGILVPATVVAGAGWTVNVVSSSPLLVETSRPEERPHLFGFHSALVMGASVIGSSLGGLLPKLFSSLMPAAADPVVALRSTLLVGVALWAVALLPLILMREEGRSLSPVSTARSAGWLRVSLSDPRLVAKLLIPTLLIAFGAGLIMPLQNVFMDRYLSATPAQIGLVIGLGSLLTGIASLVAPILALRWGKIRAAVGSQLLSLPFLAVMGLVPYFWVYAVASLIRGALMNLSNPLIANFSMEILDPHERATVNSLLNMGWSLGWAVSGWAGGWVMQNVSYTLPYAFTFVLYLSSITLFYRFFRAYDPPLARPVRPASSPCGAGKG